MTDDLEKQRELLFALEPADQVIRALAILSGLPKLLVVHGHKAHSLEIRYNLRDYTLEGLEQALEHEGFHLDHSFLHNVARNIIYYCEDTTRHNMEIKGHPTKQNVKELFVEICGQHLHQDNAGQPPEQRGFE